MEQKQMTKTLIMLVLPNLNMKISRETVTIQRNNRLIKLSTKKFHKYINCLTNRSNLESAAATDFVQIPVGFQNVQIYHACK